MKKSTAATPANNTLTYNRNFINLLKDLSTISDSVIIEKSEDEKTVIVKRKTPTSSIAYILSCPIENFNFTGKEIAIYKFGSEFYQLLNEFKEPVIEQVSNEGHDKLIIAEGEEKINYLLSDSDTIKRGPSKVEFKEPNVSLEITDEELKKIEKMVGFVGAEKVNLAFSKDKVTIKLFNSDHENSYEKVLKVKESDGEEFNLTISNEIFLLIPKAKYLIEAKKEGIICFTLMSKEGENTFKPELKIYTAELDNE
jgi:hypothetical protein